jgi:hypothetical protein
MADWSARPRRDLTLLEWTRFERRLQHGVMWRRRARYC